MGRTIITENDVRPFVPLVPSDLPWYKPNADLGDGDTKEKQGEAKPEEEEEPEVEPGREEPEEVRPPAPSAPTTDYGTANFPAQGQLPYMPGPDPSPSVDNYTDKLLKYLPAEAVALYLTLQGIVLSSGEGGALYAWLWFVFVIGIIGTPLYLWRIQQVSKRMQLAASTAAFGVWVFALGGPFASLAWYKPFLGSMLLVIFTFFVPLINPDVLNSEEAA